MCFPVPPKSSKTGVNLLQIVHYNWILLLFICLYGKTCFCHVWHAYHMLHALVTVHVVCVTPLNPRNINCLMLWLTSSLDCTPPGLTALRAVNSSLLLPLHK